MQSLDPSAIEAVMQSPEAQALGGAVVVLRRRGRILFNQCYRGFSTDQRVNLASASKWLSALVILRLVADPRMGLELDDPVRLHLPDWGAADPAKSSITVRMLLAHTSGLPSTMPGLDAPDLPLKEAALRSGELPLLFEPGTNFHYGECGLQLLGLLAERLLQLPFAEVLAKQLTAPLGLRRLSFADDEGRQPINPQLGAGLFGDALEYSAVLEALEGSLDPLTARPLLPAGLAREMLSDQLSQVEPPFSYTPYIYSRALGRSHYGLGCWLELRDPASGRTLIAGSQGRWGASPWLDLRTGLCGMLLLHDDYLRALPVYQALQQAAFDALR